MGEDAVQWAKLVIPLVVHSASKVRLRAAAALEMGLPLLLEKQKEVAAILEPLMSSVSLYSVIVSRPGYCQITL
jgi:telomere-associated protein RIF1